MKFLTIFHRDGLAAGVLAILTLTAGLVAANEPNEATALIADLTAQSKTAEKAGRSVITGADGWLFFTPELRALSVGKFWGEQALKVSRSSNPQYADPLAAIVDFNDQLRKSGIELLIVPVPAKAVVYPEKISKLATDADAKLSSHLDPNHQEFYELLRKRGVSLLDLTPRFIEQRHEAGPPLYCKTDTHWSGRAVDLAAQAIESLIQDRPWLKAVPKSRYGSKTREIEITGDLARMVDEASPVKENVPLTFIGTERGDELVPVDPNRDSPVLLMGDSHTLVFHDPELYARGAGLPDHLALRLGFPVDLIGIRGSGATTTRIELLRRRDNLKGKKLVIWCFSFREFTESATGWRKVPVIR
jgi:alginate O-acetyltransferase complex protein AlgJ